MRMRIRKYNFKKQNKTLNLKTTPCPAIFKISVLILIFHFPSC